MATASLPDTRGVEMIEQLTGRGCFAVDADRNIVAMGPRAQRITGHAASAVLGRHCLTAVRCHRCVEGCGVLEHGVVRAIPLTLYRQDGSTVDVLKNGVALRDDDGTLVGAVELIWEKTESENAAAGEPSPPEQALDRILAALGRWFVATDSAGRILRFSESLPEALDRSPEAIRNARLEEILGDPLFGPGAEFKQAVLAGERREGWRGDLRTAGGELLPVSLSAAPVGDQPGALAGTGCHPDSAMLVMLRPQDTRHSAGTVPGEPPRSFAGIIARSPRMHALFRLVDQIRDNDVNVLITGESGTGKELLARAVHARSHRAAGPFVAVNCGALPDTLLESELFGYTRGAFTGAVKDRPGRFEAAEGGTLFLDEIGDLPLPLQVKLLRVLEDGRFERLGENRTRRADVRIVAATNRDLAHAVREGRFREDLYYRLRVVPMAIPPLRRRREDLEPLIQHFAHRIGRSRGRALRFSPAAMRALLEHDWPGNVRELENAIEYATAVCEGQTIHPADLPAEVSSPAEGRQLSSTPMPAPATSPEPARSPQAGPWGRPLPADLGPEERQEAEQILRALRETRGRKGRAAETLGMSRTTLWRKLKQYRIP